MNLYRKKRGVTFLEIVLSLSILGIISTAIFANIEYCMRRNKETEYTQIASVAADATYEHIKNMGQGEFLKMLHDFKTSSAYSMKLQGYTEISGKSLFAQGNENSNTFKVYEKSGKRNVFVKVSFEDLDFSKDNYGLDMEHALTGNQNTYDDWAALNECHISILFEKNSDDKIVATLKKSEGNAIVYTPKDIDELKMSIVFYGDKFKIKSYGDHTQDQIVTDSKGMVYVSNRTGTEIPLFVDNLSENRELEIYSDQDTSESDEKIDFKSGGNIVFRKSDSVLNPFGDSISTERQCTFTIQIYDGDRRLLKAIRGNKNFTRFKK